MAFCLHAHGSCLRLAFLFAQGPVSSPPVSSSLGRARVSSSLVWRTEPVALPVRPGGTGQRWLYFELIGPKAFLMSIGVASVQGQMKDEGRRLLLLGVHVNPEQVNVSSFPNALPAQVSRLEPHPAGFLESLSVAIRMRSRGQRGHGRPEQLLTAHGVSPRRGARRQWAPRHHLCTAGSPCAFLSRNSVLVSAVLPFGVGAAFQWGPRVPAPLLLMVRITLQAWLFSPEACLCLP